jgi:peptidyl-prolyl cis-trans isomerase A (cyclophilin A)
MTASHQHPAGSGRTVDNTVGIVHAAHRPWLGRFRRGLVALCVSLGGALVGLVPIADAQAQTVRLSTNLGDIDIELHADKAPASASNFLASAKARHIDGVIFHRVISTFMVQTGGYTVDLKQKPTRKPIPLESDNGLPNVRGAVAMARTADPNSATSQFFINVVDNPFLDKANARDGQGYAVFGTVVAGMEVVDQIKAAPTTAQGMFANLPVQPITILKATIVKP